MAPRFEVFGRIFGHMPSEAPVRFLFAAHSAVSHAGIPPQACVERLERSAGPRGVDAETITGAVVQELLRDADYLSEADSTPVAALEQN